MAHDGERERRERERDEEHEVERRVGARVARRADLCSADEGGDEEGGAVHGEDRLRNPRQRFGALQQPGITPAVRELRLVGDRAAVLLGDPDHVADVVHRDQGGHVGDEVDLAFVGDIVDDTAGIADDVVIDAG